MYAKNYFYNGTEFQNKFVTLDSVQTITYSKTFAPGANLDVPGYRLRVISNDMEIGVVPTSSNQWTGMVFTDKNKTNISEIVQSYQKSGNTFWQVIITPNETNAQRRSILHYAYHPTNNVNYLMLNEDLVPSASNTFHLGASNNKWKSLNGVNPGALSLPDNSSDKIQPIETSEPIDFSQWNVSGNISANSYTPDADGWLCVNIKDSATNSVFIYPTDITSTSQYAGCAYGNGSQGIDGRLAVMLPVRANTRYNIIIKAASTSDIYSANFYPCLGNV